MELLPIPNVGNHNPSQLRVGSDHWAVRTGGDLELAITNNWIMGCCGIGEIRKVTYVYVLPTFADKAKWLAALYVSLYNCGHALFTITKGEHHRAGVAALIELGAIKIAEFPNLYHGPRMLELYLVNVRDGVGRFFNEYGEPFSEPPNPMPPIPERTMKPLDADAEYQHLPVKGA